MSLEDSPWAVIIQRYESFGKIVCVEWGVVMRPFAPLSLCRKRYELLRLAGTATCVQPLFGAGSSPADGVHVPSV